MPWVDVPIWNGSSDEAIRLVDAIGRNCSCIPLKKRCSAHDLMLSQHTLDHLLWLRWMHLHLREELCAKRSC